jgi:hypothetical protein
LCCPGHLCAPLHLTPAGLQGTSLQHGPQPARSSSTMHALHTDISRHRSFFQCTSWTHGSVVLWHAAMVCQCGSMQLQQYHSRCCLISKSHTAGACSKIEAPAQQRPMSVCACGCAAAGQPCSTSGLARHQELKYTLVCPSCVCAHTPTSPVLLPWPCLPTHR